MLANSACDQLKRENKLFCPRSRLSIWSHKTGAVVAARVSLLIFHILAEYDR